MDVVSPILNHFVVGSVVLMSVLLLVSGLTSIFCLLPEVALLSDLFVNHVCL